MGTTNRAEELANKHYDENQGYSDSVKISKNEHIQLFIQGYNSSQSEIDELTKERDNLKEKNETLLKIGDKDFVSMFELVSENAELTKSLELWKNSYTEMNKKYIDKADLHYKETTRADLLQEEVGRLRKERELFEKRCVNLSKSTDEILEYLIPFVDNNLDDNDINRIIKWHNDNSNRH